MRGLLQLYNLWLYVSKLYSTSPFVLECDNYFSKNTEYDIWNYLTLDEIMSIIYLTDWKHIRHKKTMKTA